MPVLNVCKKRAGARAMNLEKKSHALADPAAPLQWGLGG